MLRLLLLCLALLTTSVVAEAHVHGGPMGIQTSAAGRDAPGLSAGQPCDDSDDGTCADHGRMACGCAGACAVLGLFAERVSPVVPRAGAWHGFADELVDRGIRPPTPPPRA